MSHSKSTESKKRRKSAATRRAHAAQATRALRKESGKKHTVRSEYYAGRGYALSGITHASKIADLQQRSGIKKLRHYAHPKHPNGYITYFPQYYKPRYVSKHGTPHKSRRIGIQHPSGHRRHNSAYVKRFRSAIEKPFSVGTRDEVYLGLANETSGGLRRKDLYMNKVTGRILTHKEQKARVKRHRKRRSTEMHRQAKGLPARVPRVRKHGPRRRPKNFKSPSSAKALVANLEKSAKAASNAGQPALSNKLVEVAEQVADQAIVAAAPAAKPKRHRKTELERLLEGNTHKAKNPKAASKVKKSKASKVKKSKAPKAKKAGRKGK